jgi:hypothetical protein
MDCLHCGDCCLRMSPINHGRCPFILEIKDYVFCSIHYNKPIECKNHIFDNHRFCPIGINKLKPKNVDAVRERIDVGYDYCKNLQGG